MLNLNYWPCLNIIITFKIIIYQTINHNYISFINFDILHKKKEEVFLGMLYNLERRITWYIYPLCGWPSLSRLQIPLIFENLTDMGVVKKLTMPISVKFPNIRGICNWLKLTVGGYSGTLDIYSSQLYGGTLDIYSSQLLASFDCQFHEPEVINKDIFVDGLELWKCPHQSRWHHLIENHNQPHNETMIVARAHSQIEHIFSQCYLWPHLLWLHLQYRKEFFQNL